MRRIEPRSQIRIRTVQTKNQSIAATKASTKLKEPKNLMPKQNPNQNQQQKRSMMKRQLTAKNEKNNKQEKKVEKVEEGKKKVKGNCQKKMALFESFVPVIREKYGLKEFQIKILNGGYESESILVKTKDIKYVFKIQDMKRHRIQSLKHYQVQDRILEYLEENAMKGNPQTQDVLNYPKLVRTLDGKGTFSVKINKTEYSGRMITFIEGNVMGHKSYRKFGEERMRIAGILHRDFKGFKSHLSDERIRERSKRLKVKFEGRNQQECFDIAIKLRNLSYLQKNPKFKRLITNDPKGKIFECFSKENIYYKQFMQGYFSSFLKNVGSSRFSLIHNDLHGLNLILNEASDRITGVIDFGCPMQHTFFFSEFNSIFGSQFSNMPYIFTQQQFLKTLCGYVQEYDRNCPCSRLDIEQIYYLIGIHLLKHNNDRYGNDKRMTIFGRLTWHYLRTDPKQFITRMQEACLDNRQN